MSFFRNFPNVNYFFGNEKTSNSFPNLSAYVDLLDQIKHQVNFYTDHYIDNEERPDTLSYKLYGTVDFYWTFFLVNDDLRISGWPFPEYKAIERAKELYPNTTLVTSDLDSIYENFLVGQSVDLNSGETVKIIDRHLDLGQIVVKGEVGDNTGKVIVKTGTVDTLLIDSQSPEYEAVHHYEDGNGNWLDIDPTVKQTFSGTVITYQEYLEAYNETLRQIKVIKPGSIRQIINEFNRKLRA